MKAKDIQWHLATRKSSPFYVRRMAAVVPNVSWGLLYDEADLIVLSKTGYLTEVEIKISMADWKADLSKTKWKRTNYQDNLVKRFFYAAPAELAIRYAELQLPEFAGVISISDRGLAIVIKEAGNIKGHKKLSLLQVHKLLRLASIKAWRMAYKPEKDEA